MVGAPLEIWQAAWTLKPPMNQSSAIAYVSSAIRLLAETELETLLLDARNFNAAQGVTGVLLYHDGTFFQYFEGPEAAVSQVYARIKKSSLHRGMIELLNEPAQQRQFSGWHMGFSAVPQSTLLRLERASWADISNDVQGRAASSAGLDLLLQFWRGAQ